MMRRASHLIAVAATLLAVGGATAALRPPARAQATGGEAVVPTSLTQARAQAARARERAAMLDRQARRAALASERATLAAAALAARVQQSEAALAAADAELAEVGARRRALDRSLAAQREPVARLLAALQTQARRPTLLTLLQPGSIDDAVHLRAVLTAVAPQIDARTASLRKSLARTRELEAASARMVRQRAGLQAALVARRNELASVSAVERIKAMRAAGSADREAERAFAIAESARSLSTLVNRLDRDDRRQRPRPGPASTSATAPRPYRLPVEVPQSQVAGPADRTLTLLARPGTLVIAPAAGRVAFAGPYRGYGGIVIVEHTDGWTSLVTGLAKVRVAVGQPLIAGSPLGDAPMRDARIGLELRRNGQRVNPLDQMR